MNGIQESGAARVAGRIEIVPEAGHWVQYEAAADINALLLQWLNPFPHPQET